MNNPYKQCPVYKSANFTLRLVSEEDAQDLLTCYGDPKAQMLFNTDGFATECKFTKPEEMLSCIKFWLKEYSQEAYVRFAVVDNGTNKAVGTIEMFGGNGSVGILRIDLGSEYEKQSLLGQLLDIAVKYFYALFDVDCIATKAVPEAVTRIYLLQSIGFQEKSFNGRSHYYLRAK